MRGISKMQIFKSCICDFISVLFSHCVGLLVHWSVPHMFLSDALSGLTDAPLGLSDAPLGLSDTPIGLSYITSGLSDASSALSDT